MWQTGSKGKEWVWEVGPTVCSHSGKGNTRCRESILQQEREQRVSGYCWEGLWSDFGAAVGCGAAAEARRRAIGPTRGRAGPSALRSSLELVGGPSECS